jgi:aryl-alcohol dehydrogenase-like predicted oxidoreductase
MAQDGPAPHSGYMNGDTYLLAGHKAHRMGFDAMQLPGSGVFGPPLNRQNALEILRFAVRAGVDHIDTAQFYGPDVANELIHEALYPYPDGLVLVSKVGARRDDVGGVHGAQRLEELREGVLANLFTLQLDQVPVVNLRAPSRIRGVLRRTGRRHGGHARRGPDRGGRAEQRDARAVPGSKRRHRCGVCAERLPPR